MKILKTSQIGLILFIIIQLASGCRQNQTYGRGKVKSQICCTGGACDTTFYTYDASERLSSITKSNNPTQRYAYTAASITVSNAAGSGTDGQYTLSSSGLASGYDVIGQSFPQISYTYDNNGYLTYTNFCCAPTYTNYTILNGNTTISYWFEPIQYSAGGADTTYYSFLSDTDRRDYGMPFLGRANVNLVSTDSARSSTYYYGQTSFEVIVKHHNYTFDGQHRVATETTTSSGGSVSICSYTYY